MKQTAGIACFFICLLTLIGLSGCGQEKKAPILRIGHAPQDHHAPLYIAAMNGDYFREHGGIWLKENVSRHEYELMDQKRLLAKVVIDSSTGGKELVQRLAEHQYDMGLGGVPAMLSFIDQGSAIRIVAPIMADGAGLVVRPDMAVASWVEFVSFVRAGEQPVKIGYKIAVSVQNLIFEQALKESGLSYDRDQEDTGAMVRLINLYGEKNLLPALENGLVDGFVANQPFLALAEEKGIGKVAATLGDLPPEGKWRGIPCCALAAADSYVSDHPEVVEAMVTLMMRANRFIKEYPEKSGDQIAQWLAIDPGVERKSLPTISYIEEYNDDWERGVTFWVETMIAAGLLKEKVKDAYGQDHLSDLIYGSRPEKAGEKK
ncbi:MAG: ABC transporter substrate-binding protein [Pseudomonadota bacterium]